MVNLGYQYSENNFRYCFALVFYNIVRLEKTKPFHFRRVFSNFLSSFKISALLMRET